MKIYTQIQNEDKAFEYIIQQFRKFDFMESAKRYNKNRHLLINTKIGNFYCLYKRELFHSFQQKFPEFIFKNPLGLNLANLEGESINKEFLDIAIEKDAILLYIYPDRKIYKAYPAQLKRIAEKCNLIRTQDRHNTYKMSNFTDQHTLVQEITYSFPFTEKLFKEFKVEDEVKFG